MIFASVHVLTILIAFDRSRITQLVRMQGKRRHKQNHLLVAAVLFRMERYPGLEGKNWILCIPTECP